jgi:hypothetical protein
VAKAIERNFLEICRQLPVTRLAAATTKVGAIAAAITESKMESTLKTVSMAIKARTECEKTLPSNAAVHFVFSSGVLYLLH